MKNARIHLIYLTIIGFWAYQYWTKAQALNEAVGSIEQFDKLLKRNNEVVDKTATMIYYKIEKDAYSYPSPTNKAFFEKTKNFKSVSSSLNTWFEKLKTEFINVSGGFDKTDSTLLANRFSTKTSRQFFSEQKIKEIRDSLARFQDTLMDIAKQYRDEYLKNQYGTIKLLTNEVYWQSLNKLTDADALSRLTYIQNQLALDKIPYLNYVYSIVGYRGLIFDQFKVAIAPNKAALIEGETIKADVYLAAYSSNPGTDVTIFVNNREIPLKDGVSHFERIEKSRGKKTIRAEARVTNPFTCQTISQFGEFEYEVLPKCSRDCH